MSSFARSSILAHPRGFGKAWRGGTFPGRLRAEGQEDPEHRAPLGAVVHLDPPVVVLDYSLGHRQAKAGPLAGVLGGEEGRSEERRVGKVCESRWSTYV